MSTFQEFLSKLTAFWEKHGCVVHHGYDLEVGAGTFNPATFLRCLGPEPYRAAYVEPCRRPTDGRYGTNPNRLQHFFQYQVILKPSPPDIQDLYLQSLAALGFDLTAHDIRFVHDDWESPTLGAWGLGWEVWMDGMEISQFTYFQAVGGIELRPITGEITYGIERLAMYLQGVNRVFDLQWNDEVTYGDIYHRNEVEWSQYNFEEASISMWQHHFEDYVTEAARLVAKPLPIPAYDFVMKASHAFNLLDARGALSPTERTGYIARIRDLARQVAESYLASREREGYPLLRFTPSSIENSSSSFLSFSHSCDSTATEDYLLEIGSEELPDAFVEIGRKQLQHHMQRLLQEEGIVYEEIITYATPRRLAIYVRCMALTTSQQKLEKKGPPLGQAYDAHHQLTPAGEGFFRSLQLPPLTWNAIQSGEVPQVQLREVKGVLYLYGTLTKGGESTREILQKRLPALILNLEFPKKMRWGSGDIAYPRPLRWFTSLLGNQLVPFQLASLIADRLTYGHRQLAPQAISLTHARNYLDALRQHAVMADCKEREQSIRSQIQDIEAKTGLQVIAQDEVLPRVLHLVEWPYLTQASFSESFLELPCEVLISEMVTHQRYFPIAHPDGTLHSSCLITANIPPTPQIIQGNQRVLSARLTDGAFLYREDLKHPMEIFNEKLKKVVFQKELGSVYDKVQRLIAHATYLSQLMGIGETEKVKRAALLCKADLASHMVYEFPELQGIMGSYYARAQGEDEAIVRAIEEHWRPRREQAPLPESPLGMVISLADKFDNLLGCFALNLKPTSSSDPYALRRQVFGIIKMLIHGRYELPLAEALRGCAAHFPSSLFPDPEKIVQEVLTFIMQRIRTVFQDDALEKDEIEASLAQGCHDIYDTFCRVTALHQFRLERPHEFHALYEVYKRAKGQIGSHSPSPMRRELLVAEAERHLQSVLDRQSIALQATLAQRDYPAAYRLIASVQPALAQLFEEVKILTEDVAIRDNRLALLQQVFDLFSKILDFGKIQPRI